GWTRRNTRGIAPSLTNTLPLIALRRSNLASVLSLIRYRYRHFADGELRRCETLLLLSLLRCSVISWAGLSVLRAHWLTGANEISRQCDNRIASSSINWRT